MKWIDLKIIGNHKLNKGFSCMAVNDMFFFDKALEKRFYGNIEFYHEMVNLFIVSSEEKLFELKQAINSDDIDKVKSSAHFIKGGAANVGAYKITELAEQMELLKGDEGLHVIEDLLSELILEMKELYITPH